MNGACWLQAHRPAHLGLPAPVVAAQAHSLVPARAGEVQVGRLFQWLPDKARGDSCMCLVDELAPNKQPRALVATIQSWPSRPRSLGRLDKRHRVQRHGGRSTRCCCRILNGCARLRRFLRSRSGQLAWVHTGIQRTRKGMSSSRGSCRRRRRVAAGGPQQRGIGQHGTAGC